MGTNAIAVSDVEIPQESDTPSRQRCSAPGAFEPLGPPASWSLITYSALISLIVIWGVQVYLTWAAWGNLTIDSGREMYVPAMLAEGKELYRDLRFIYGPASPYFNGTLFRIFGVHLNVLYWAGSLSALGSAIFLYLTGMRLSSWIIGWAAGAVVLLEAFQPSLFCFPLPYSFAAVYGCLIGCAFLWMAVNAADSRSWLWMLGAGSAAAVMLLLKLEFGMACYGTLVLLIAARGWSQRSWGSVVKDVLAIAPGVVVCASVVLWMVSIGGIEFMTQENIESWPTSYFMTTYGQMWLERNGFTLSISAFGDALLRAAPIAGLVAALFSPLWKRVGARAFLGRSILVVILIVYLFTNLHFRAPWPEGVEFTLDTFFFPQDMVLYVVVAALVAWGSFWFRRAAFPSINPAVPLLLTFSSLLAFRILMKMSSTEYSIYCNGPVVLSFLWLACRFIPRSSFLRKSAFVGELLICLACVAAVGLYAGRSEVSARDYVPLATERGTIRVSKSLAKNYEAAIHFMKEKAASGQAVLSVPEDTSLYFLSGTYAPTRIFVFTPGALAPGKITEATIREMEQKHVRYLLWSNRTFMEYGAPIFGRDFSREFGDYLTSHYHRVGPLIPPTSVWEWSAAVWERKTETQRLETVRLAQPTP